MIEVTGRVPAYPGRGRGSSSDSKFEPRILGILCTLFSYSGADSAGQAHTPYPPNVEVVRVMCSGRVDPAFIVSALADGADGVLVCGEGHGKIHIFLNDAGNVDRAYLQIPELRGFEKFAEGRPAEDMPQITSRICGVCPTAHHMAAHQGPRRPLRVEPTPAAKKIREMVYSAFFVEDHALHFYFLGGPDFVVGPRPPRPSATSSACSEGRARGGQEGHRPAARAPRAHRPDLGGKVIHPVFGLPGGVAKAITAEDRRRWVAGAKHAVEFAEFTLEVFRDLVLKNSEYVELITSDTYTHRTYYMGTGGRRATGSTSTTASSASWTPTGREFRSSPPATTRSTWPSTWSRGATSSSAT